MFSAEEEYKRLSEALADEGTYNAVAFKYSADYYDPSQPTEEEDANKEAGEDSLTSLVTLTYGVDRSVMLTNTNRIKPPYSSFFP